MISCSKVDNAIRRISIYPPDSAIGFPNTYHWIVIHPVDSAIHLLNNQDLVGCVVASVFSTEFKH